MLVLFASLSFHQAENYRAAEILYRSVLAANPQCWMADYNLGVTLHQEKRIPEAADAYLKRARPAAKISPGGK